ncbi:MAG: hypothetical protein ABII23_07190, partial [bacterium]
FLFIIIKHIRPAYLAIQHRNLAVSVSGLIFLIMIIMLGAGNFIMNMEVSILFWFITMNIWNTRPIN